MRFALAALAAAVCAQERAPAPSEPAIAVPRPALASVRDNAHAALARHCGSCHEAHQPTANPKALAVFDLDQPDWPEHFDERRFAVALQRFASKPAADKAAFVALRDAELAARAKP